MSVTNKTTEDSSQVESDFNAKALKGKGHWSAANIAAMIVGFIVFPILGLALLFWTILGNPIQELPNWLRRKWADLVSSRSEVSKEDIDNVVFNEYQENQFDRIKEIKEQILKSAEDFRVFRSETKRRQDQQEFDDFMSSKPGNGAS